MLLQNILRQKNSQTTSFYENNNFDIVGQLQGKKLHLSFK